MDRRDSRDGTTVMGCLILRTLVNRRLNRPSLPLTAVSEIMQSHDQGDDVQNMRLPCLRTYRIYPCWGLLGSMDARGCVDGERRKGFVKEVGRDFRFDAGRACILSPSLQLAACAVCGRCVLCATLRVQ